MLTKIKKINFLDDFTIHSLFSDNVEKTVDFKPYIGSDDLSKPLSDPEYFKKVSVYQNGRGIFWPNSYDFCQDFLRNV